jgi:hypothetical protein
MVLGYAQKTEPGTRVIAYWLMNSKKYGFHLHTMTRSRGFVPRSVIFNCIHGASPNIGADGVDAMA